MFGNIFGNIEKMKSELSEKRAELGKKLYEGEAGAGMVVATVNGSRQLTHLKIDSSLVKPEDQDMMQDLIIAATNKAYANMEADMKRELSAVMKDKLPNIPGLDLSEIIGNL